MAVRPLEPSKVLVLFTILEATEDWRQDPLTLYLRLNTFDLEP